MNTKTIIFILFFIFYTQINFSHPTDKANVFTVINTKTNSRQPFCSSRLPDNHWSVLLDQIFQAAEEKRMRKLNAPNNTLTSLQQLCSKTLSLEDITFITKNKPA